MFLRWLHKSWKYFWRVFLSLLLIVVLLGGIIIALLQLDVTQDYLTNRIEQQIQDTYHARLSVGDVDGFLPFRFSLHDVVLTRTDSTIADTLASVDTVDTQIDVWGLLRNRVTITGFSMHQPRFWIRSDEEGRRPFLEPRESEVSSDETSEDSWFSQIEILAPAVAISGGSIFLESQTTENKIGNLPPSFALKDIEATFFVDWNENQRYLDIESFSAKSQDLNTQNLSFSGQIYSDDRFLEFNSFYVNLDDSRFILNGEIEGVNLIEPNFTDQLLQANYNLEFRSDRLRPTDLRDLIPNIPQTDAFFTVDIEAEGTTDSLQVDYASLGLGESLISLDGLFKNLRDRNAFSYDIFLNEMELQKDDIGQLVDTLTAPQYQALENLKASGTAAGTLDSVDVDVEFQSPLGELAMKGGSQLTQPFAYSGTLTGARLNISPFLPGRIDSSSLNFNAQLNGSGLSMDNAVSELTASLYNSRINDVSVDQFELTSSLRNGFWEHEYEYYSGNEQFRGTGNIDFSREERPLVMRGNAENIDLAKFFPNTNLVETKLNFDYNVELENLNLNQLYGRANLDIHPSLIDGDSVEAHQFYVDLNSADEDERALRLTSSLFDLNISGDLLLANIIEHGRFWIPHLQNQFRHEILMDSSATELTSETAAPQQNLVLEGDFTAKDLSLVKRYLPNFPTINTDSEITFSANTDGTRLLLSTELQADSLQYNDINLRNSQTQLTASFRNDRRLKEFSTVDLEAQVGSLRLSTVNMDSLAIDLAVKQDSINYTQHIGSISDNAEHRMSVRSALSDSTVNVSIEDFFLGNDQYAWTNESQPSFTYKRNGQIEFHNFNFQNEKEYFQLQGTLSSNRSDSLTYVLRDINLDRISDLIRGEVDFAGVLNGTLVTRSLTRQPTIQGELAVNRFRLDDRLVGDVSFNSQFDADNDRFNTQIDIVTDSTKYQDYLAENDDIGQNIRLDGYFVTPDPQVQQDSLYYFNANFNQVDMWVLPLVLDNIFQDMEGQASGEGYITGNFDDFDFHADFETENVFAKPRFVNTNYFVNGPVSVDRHEGVVLDSLDILDTKGGTGIVWGTIDFNDFKPVTYLDLTLDMDELQFLNNNMDPDVPFYGNVSGSGLVRLTGSNNDMFMRTPDPVMVTDDSEVSIPLLEETELNETGKFIQFVESFEERKTGSSTNGNGGSVDQSNLEGEELQEAIREMTFSERFDLDLQFEASDDVTVNLIFDPVTGEILTAEGTGQLRITMQDQDMQMFGRYNINSGNYQFVTGEIISRRLELEPGGTIVWEGAPDNARLDISAVYDARPNITSLTSETTVESQNQNGGQRVPIELIVEINGTLNSVENDYYFQLPSSIDLSSNSTLQYTINEINRDEQQKLLQATSILFTGQFIPTAQAGGSSTASLSQSLTRGSTVLNPLLSNQVISPLLSNQINALLNSDVSRFDVDFNLNAYNEVDLGIALRLYNDRLIFRREGQITGGGTQSSLEDRIGDLNATYRIQRGLSLTAFHRQDQVLNSLGTGGSQAGEVTPSVDGLGLESQVRFNTWKELTQRIKDTFRNIFGMNKNDNDGNEEKEIVKQEAIKEEK